ncbi:uncharacterized protein [Setaria viridis]|uniref:uncharacterized protein n=1 Tax=Setaria viridis TaxID=4556 RepID=UPI003B3A8F9C
MEQILAAHTQLLQNLANSVASLQAQVNQTPPAPLVHPRDKHREFMSHRPPTYSHSTDPLQADDWLRNVEKKLEITQCNNREKVLYASGRLEGPAADWWDSYIGAHEDSSTITWQEFKINFSAHHIPASVIKLKKQEFLSLKQEGMSVNEYRDKFIQLSRYAPEKVATDDKKQDHFLEGLDGHIQYQLVAHTFSNFQHLVDKALLVEDKHRELQEKKRKFNSQIQSSSNSHPRLIQEPWPQDCPVNQYRNSGQYPLEPPEFQEPHPNFQTPRPATPGTSQMISGDPRTPTKKACFCCKKEGHLIGQCPKKLLQLLGKNNQKKAQVQTLLSNDNQVPVSGNWLQSNYEKGKVNHITIDSARSSTDVVLGTFLVNSTPAVALIDSGASHDFVSK